jgi:TolA-binding protein
MKISILTMCIVLLLAWNVLGQIPESEYFSYLTETFNKRNSDISDYLISEFNFYLQIYADAPHIDETLFMLATLYEEDKEYPEAFISFLKIKYLVPNSAKRSDAITGINQLVHNKAGRTFKGKRTLIDEKMIAPISFIDRNSAFFEYLELLHKLDIEDINELLQHEISLYLSIYSKEAKNYDQLLFWYAELYEKSKDWQEAVAAYTKLIYLSGESSLIPQTLFRIAYLQYKETGQYEEATANFTQLLNDYQESDVAGDAQFYLAEMYQEEFDNNQEAINNYLKLIETYPKNKNAVEALKRVAEIHEKQDRFEQAISTYYQIFELFPEDSYASKALLEIESLYRRKLHDYQKAIEILKLYTTQYPNNEDAAERLYDAAELFEDELKDKQAAIDTYTEVIDKFPDSKYAKRAKNKIEDLSQE